MPKPAQDDSQRKALIAALQAEVEIQERNGQMNTVHHEMLRNLLKDEPKPVIEKKDDKNKEID